MPALCFSLSIFGKEPVAPKPDVKCDQFSLADKGESMEHVPVLDQGDIGTCYAYAASEAVDAWRFSAYPQQGIGFHTSPHATAISTKASAAGSNMASLISDVATTPGKSALESDEITEAVRALKKDGICSYNALGANFNDTMYGQDPKTFWKQLENFYALYHKQYMSALIAQDQSKQNLILNQGSVTFATTFCNAGFSRDQSNFRNIAAVMRIITADSVFGALKEFSAKACSGNTMELPSDFPERPVTFNLIQITNPSTAKAIKPRSLIFSRIIGAMFDFKKKQPIMIGYCDEVLMHPDNEGIDDKDGNIDSKNCASHASLIIGRGKMTDGRCGFLIRNSWGTDRDDGHGLVSNIDANGDVWVAEDDLYRNLDEISVLPPKGESYHPPLNAYEGTVPPAPKDENLPIKKVEDSYR